MATNKSKIQIGIELSEEEAKKVLANLNAVTEAAQKLESTGTSKSAASEQAAEQDKVTQAIKSSVQQYQFEDEKLNKLLATAREQGKQEQFFTTLMKKGYTEGITDIEKMLGLRREGIALSKQEIQALQRRATEERHESIALRRASADLHLFSQTAFITGSAIIGGAFLIADQYVKSLEKGTAATAEFQAAQNRLTFSKNKIADVFAKELVPFLNEAREVLDQAGKFITAHPEVVPAAIKAGEVLIAVGVIGKGIATATRLTADFLAIQSSITRLIATRAEDALAAEKQMAAAELQNAAADKQIAAGEEQSAVGLASTERGAVSAAGNISAYARNLGIIGLILTGGITISIAAGKAFNALGDELIKLGGLGVSAGTGMKVVTNGLDEFKKRIIDLDAVVRVALGAGLSRFLPEAHVAHRTATTPTGRTDISDVFTSVQYSEHLDELLADYQKYKDEDLQAQQDHLDKLLKIRKDEADAEIEANKKLADTIDQVTQDLNRSIERIQENAARAEEKALRALQQADEKAERKYNRDRESAIRDADRDIEKIRQRHKDALIKIEKEHAEKETEALQARDAVALLKERKRYNDALSEEQGAAEREVAERKQQLRERLQELRENFEIEKQERHEDYEIAKAERAEQVAEQIAEAQQRAKDRIEEAQKLHDEEIKKAREQMTQKLAEEDKQYAAERDRRYKAFLAQIKDLDAALLGMRSVGQLRYSQLITDFDAFLLQARAKLGEATTAIGGTAVTASTGTVGHKAYGGYASYGMYWLGDSPAGTKGPDEFVMQGNTTKTAESIIGSKLSQENVVKAMLRGGGKGSSITLNDHRRFDSRVPASDRRDIREETVQMISELVRR